MCVAVIAWHAHPRWRLVAIGNRDELHARPSAPLARWDDGVIAGRDLVGGGTWLGLDATGRFVLVTNRRGFGEPDPTKRSRGALVTGLLAGTNVALSDLDAYNPFSLLLVAGSELEFLTNRPSAVRTTLGHGLYGLSNGALDDPWPKTLALKAALTDWLAEDEPGIDPLFAALRSETVPPLGIAPAEMSEQVFEPRNTPPFIRHPLYGTRCSTIVTIAADGSGTAIERRFSASADDLGETRIDYVWSGET